MEGEASSPYAPVALNPALSGRSDTYRERQFNGPINRFASLRQPPHPQVERKIHPTNKAKDIRLNPHQHMMRMLQRQPDHDRNAERKDHENRCSCGTLRFPKYNFAFQHTQIIARPHTRYPTPLNVTENNPKTKTNAAPSRIYAFSYYHSRRPCKLSY